MRQLNSRNFVRALKCGCVGLLGTFIIDLAVGPARGEDTIVRGKAEVARERGEAELAKRDFAPAIKSFSEAVRFDPKYAEAYRLRGVALAESGDYDKAVADFTTGLSLDANSAVAWYCRGLTFVKRGEYEKAIADQSQAIRLRPKYESAYLSRGEAYERVGDGDKAIADYSEAIRIEPKDVNAYLDLGLACEGKGDYASAIAEFTAAARIAPANALPILERGLAYSRKGDSRRALTEYSDAIRLNPNLLRAYWNRGVWYDERGDRARAIADLDQAIRLAPKSSLSRALRGCIRVRSGDYDGGLADLRAGIVLDPTDPAAKFEAWPKAPLTAEAIRFGEDQVRKMLRDRPAMAQYGKEAEPLCRWAARKFAGEDLMRRIRWDPTEPLGGQAQNSGPVAEGTFPWIRIGEKYFEGEKKGKARAAEDLWSSAVYELYNITESDDFRRLDADAAAGRVTKPAYIAKIGAIESRAIHKTRAFYVNVFLPWAKEYRVPSDPWRWFVWAQYDAQEGVSWLQTDMHGIYATYYEHRYDFAVLQSLVEKGDYKSAVKLASEMLPASLGNVDRARILASRAIAYLAEEDADKAIRDLDEAIRLEPNHPSTYVTRGRAHSWKRELDKVIADEDAAIRLNAENNPVTNAEAYCVRGWAYGEKLDLDKEIADETEAIRLYPKNPEPFRNRASAYEQKGDKAKADLDAKRAKELEGKP